MLDDERCMQLVSLLSSYFFTKSLTACSEDTDKQNCNVNDA